MVVVVFMAHEGSFEMNDKTEKLNEEDLMNLLVSKKRVDCLAAVHEIVKRGETMFDFLLKLKGNKDFFHGAVHLGNHSPSTFVYVPDPDYPLDEYAKEKVITVEITALWLISAIYFQRIEISRSAVLRDLNIELSKSISNKMENVERAYQSVEKWVEKCKREGISSLRENKIDPLAGSNLKWW